MVLVTLATKLDFLPDKFAFFMQIDEEVGYWRAFGFGIVSMYKSELLMAGGLDTSILGWGQEDVDLFEKVSVLF